MGIIISIFIIVVAVAWLGLIIYRHWPDLNNLNLESLSEAKSDQAKAEILEAQIKRKSDKVAKKINQVIKNQSNFFIQILNDIKEKIEDLEDKYRSPEKVLEKQKSIDQLLSEADDLFDQSKYTESEKILIEVILRSKRSITAYRQLGEVYLAKRDYDQAEEVYNYLLKLYLAKERKAGNKDFESLKSLKLEDLESDFLNSLEVDPAIGVCYDHLGEIYEIRNKKQKALDCYLKASSISPNNPKYLDRLIQLSLIFKDKGLAKRALNRLDQINPDNAKLPEYREDIEKI